MTPKEFQALRDQRQENEQLIFLHHGVVAATVANVNRDPNKTKPFTPADFAPQKRRYLTIEESEAAMECWVQGVGGVDLRKKGTDNNGAS